MKERIALELLLVFAGIAVFTGLMTFTGGNIGLTVFLFTLQLGWGWNVSKVAAWIIKRREGNQANDK